MFLESWGSGDNRNTKMLWNISGILLVTREGYPTQDSWSRPVRIALCSIRYDRWCGASSLFVCTVSAFNRLGSLVPQSTFALMFVKCVFSLKVWLLQEGKTAVRLASDTTRSQLHLHRGGWRETPPTVPSLCFILPAIEIIVTAFRFCTLRQLLEMFVVRKIFLYECCSCYLLENLNVLKLFPRCLLQYLSPGNRAKTKAC